MPPDKGVVYVYRDSNILGFAIQPIVMVNGRPVANLKPGGYGYAIVPPGETWVSAATEASSSITIEVKAQQEYYVRERIGVGFWVGRLHPSVVPKEIALASIQSTKLQGR